MARIGVTTSGAVRVVLNGTTILGGSSPVEKKSWNWVEFSYSGSRNNMYLRVRPWSAVKGYYASIPGEVGGVCDKTAGALPTLPTFATMYFGGTGPAVSATDFVGYLDDVESWNYRPETLNVLDGCL